MLCRRPRRAPSTWASATARCSAATRRSSRSRPPRPSTPSCARRWATPRWRSRAAAGYVGAGTAEFLLGRRRRLVLPRAERAAAGRAPGHRGGLPASTWCARSSRSPPAQPLELEQADVAPRGHAIECRLYAEDPAAGFLPATGRLAAAATCRRWPGVRVDAGVREGDQVGVRYDPLLAKVIAHAEDRDACVERMAAALAETVVLGRHHQPRLPALAARPARCSARGDADTGFVDREWPPSWCRRSPTACAPRRAGRRRWHAFGRARRRWTVSVAGGRRALHRGWQYRLGGRRRARSRPAAGGRVAGRRRCRARCCGSRSREGDEVDRGPGAGACSRR